jgi:hypothetical protein
MPKHQGVLSQCSIYRLFGDLSEPSINRPPKFITRAPTGELIDLIFADLSVREASLLYGYTRNFVAIKIKINKVISKYRFTASPLMINFAIKNDIFHNQGNTEGKLLIKNDPNCQKN